MFAHARHVQQPHPDLPLAQWVGGLALEQQGKYAVAATASETWLRMSSGNRRAIPDLGHVYGLLGRHADALRLSEDSRDGTTTNSLGPVETSLIYVGLGDKESAFSWLEKGY